MRKKRRSPARKSRRPKLRAAAAKTSNTGRRRTSTKKTIGASKKRVIGQKAEAAQEAVIGTGEALRSAEPWGIYIEEQNAKFRVKHHYTPTPNPDEPTTFDDEVIETIGEAETREGAEKIKQEYEAKLAEAADEDREDE